MPPKTSKEPTKPGDLVSYCHHDTAEEHSATLVRFNNDTKTNADLNIHDEGGHIIGGVSGVPLAADPTKRTKKSWWP